MRRFWIIIIVLAFGACLAATGRSQEPMKITVCQLISDPPAYNHMLVEVEAFVSHDFEDFSLLDPTCHAWPWVWLEYGGKSKSDTMYCCGPTAGKSRPHELKVEDIEIPLVENDQFREFDKLIQPPFRSGTHGVIVHATIVGRFFAGRKQTYPNGKTAWAGFGHMGCCSILVIQEIKSVDPQDRDDLDYGASYDQPDISKAGCGYSFLTPIEMSSNLLQAQHEADQGVRAWAFDDPQRVASEALMGLAKLKVQGPLSLKETSKASGRIVYEWRETAKSSPFMVVVSRPYWLSFYAHDPKHVAWVVVAAYKSSCESNNSVTRIR
jgi:hypothetical protein